MKERHFIALAIVGLVLLLPAIVCIYHLTSWLDQTLPGGRMAP